MAGGDDGNFLALFFRGAGVIPHGDLDNFLSGVGEVACRGNVSMSSREAG
jgi:hypothetical protein